MNQIAAEAEAEKQAELRAQDRSRMLAKVRRVGSFLILTTILACGFFYRTELQNLASAMFDKAPQASKTQQIGEQTAGAVRGIEASAAKRDAAMDDILGQPNKK